MNWMISRLRLAVSLALGLIMGGIVIALVLLGIKHSRLRHEQLRLTKTLNSKTKSKIIEVQNAQFNAAISVRSGRDELAERMRRGQF